MLKQLGRHRLVEFPSPVDREVYCSTIDRLAERLKSVEGVVAVYQIGGVSNPGISDIDMVVVFEDEVACTFNPREDLTPSEKYLVVHSLYGTSRKHFEEAQRYSFFHNYRLLWGSDCRQEAESKSAQTEHNLKRQIAIEYLLRMFINLAIQSEFGVVKVRSTLLQAKAVAYDLEFLAVDSGRLAEIVRTVPRLRDQWFESPSSSDRFRVFVDQFATGLYEFLQVTLAHEAFYLPADRLQVARSVTLGAYEGGDLTYRRSGILLPSFCVGMGRRYYSLQNRLTHFHFSVPAHTRQVPSEIEGRFVSIGEMSRYNKITLPNFAPLASSLYQI